MQARATAHQDAGARVAAGVSADAAAVVDDVIRGHVRWQERFGETSYDHQSYFAGPLGRRAKALYYRDPASARLPWRR